jgi:hypothetical protein
MEFGNPVMKPLSITVPLAEYSPMLLPEDAAYIVWAHAVFGIAQTAATSAVVKMAARNKFIVCKCRGVRLMA